MPVLSRSLVLFFLLKVSYINQERIAQLMVENIPVKWAWFILVLVLAVGSFYFPIAVIATLVGVYLLYRLMVKRLGGFTGDTLGAVVELSELFFILAIVLALNY